MPQPSQEIKEVVVASVTSGYRAKVNENEAEGIN